MDGATPTAARNLKQAGESVGTKEVHTAESRKSAGDSAEGENSRRLSCDERSSYFGVPEERRRLRQWRIFSNKLTAVGGWSNTNRGTNNLTVLFGGEYGNER